MAYTKRCSTCHLAVPKGDCNRYAAAEDGLQPRCRACCRRWYEEHRTAHIANVYRRNEAYRSVLFDKVASYLADHPCVDCGERDVRCLVFNHRDRGTKLKEVSTLIRHAHSWKLVLHEIEKCDVRCANCHRKNTAAEDNSWRHLRYLELVLIEQAGAPSDVS